MVNIGKGENILLLFKPVRLTRNSIALEFVTSGLARATSHRVLSPTGTTPRYSVPFFQNIGLDVKLTERVLTCPYPFISLWNAIKNTILVPPDILALSDSRGRVGATDCKSLICSTRDKFPISLSGEFL